MFATCLLVLALCGSIASSVTAAEIPKEWKGLVASNNAFFAEDDSAPLDSSTGYPEGLYLPLIGNGYISHAQGVRSDTMFVSGVFNGETTSPSHRAAIPASFAVTVDNSETTGVLLNVQTGVYHRRGRIIGSPATFELRWYAHRSLRSLYVLEMEVHLNGSEEAELSLTTNTLSSTVDFTELSRRAVRGGGAVSVCRVTTIPEVADGPTTTVCVVADTIPSSLKVARSDSGKVFTFVSVTRTSLDDDASASDAAAIETAALADHRLATALAAEKTLLSQHESAWASLWQSGVEIEGRPDVAAAVNASLFAVLSSVRDDWHYGLAPGGLTNYYNGHSFWDTETWMYPPLLFLQPEIARSLVQYRFDRLDGAARKAQSYSPPWAGAMFPWESAFSGVETCPTFAATGLREDHISGDISLAVWQEWCMRRDESWLRSVGFPILSGVADFWVSRAVYETDAQGVSRAHIKDIIPPDEYVDHVDDSVYSNFVASKALQFASQAAEILKIDCVSCAQYEALAEDLVILFDASHGIHPEYRGYPGNEIKQADVVLLHYPLGMEMNETVRRADLEFYSERTDRHGPAMTWGMHSIGFLDLGDVSQAAQYFNMSFQDNLHAPLQVWTETPDGNAVNFITGAGGFLQTMINGYPGFRITSEGLVFSPRCVQGATKIRLRGVHYLDAVLDVAYSCDAQRAVSLTLTPRSESALSLQLLSGRVYETVRALSFAWKRDMEHTVNLAQLGDHFKLRLVRP